MQLTVRDVTKLLNVTEDTIYRWIEEHNMPASFEDGQYRFNKSELLDWATASKITLSSAIFKEPEDSVMPTLAEALETGGIFHHLAAEDKESALQEVVRRMTLPDSVDRQFLLSVLLAREAAASTSIGDGIAFPHVRNPIVLQVKEPMVTLSFLEKPIEYGAVDGKLVFALFTLVCPTVRIHLHLLSRLAFALRIPVFKTTIECRVPSEEILKLVRDIENQMPKQPQTQGR
ncbi:MAG: PTS sugar transporter subunit IIA [bacterium]